MPAIDELKQILSTLNVEYSASDHAISVKPNEPGGFEVELTEHGDEISIHFEAWHEHSVAPGPAIEHFLAGLTDHVRLRVSRFGGNAWRWTAEFLEGEDWNALGSMYYPFSMRFWRKSEKVYLQNHRISFDTVAHLTWENRLQLALQVHQSGDHEKAQEMLSHLLDSARKHFGLESSRVANALHNLGEVRLAQGDISEARKFIEQALSILERAEPNSRYFAFVLVRLANIYAMESRYSEAEQLGTRALEIMERAGAPETPDIASALEWLGRFYGTTEQWEKALPSLARLVSIRERALGKDHLEVALALVNVASAHSGLSHFSDAEPLFKRAIGILEPHAEAGTDDSLMYALNGLGQVYELQGDYRAAAPLYERSLRLREKHLGSDHSAVATGCNNLAVAYTGLGRDSEAEDLYRRALEISERSPMPVDRLVSTYMNYATLLEKLGRHEEASGMKSRIRAIETGH